MLHNTERFCSWKFSFEGSSYENMKPKEVPNTPENETLYPEMQLFEAEMRPEIESKAGNGV